MKRIFLAIDISDDARSAAAVYARELRSEFPGLRVGWERPEKLHLTLKFLGDTAKRQLDSVCDAAQKIAAEFPPFKLSICGTGAFPDARNPRILWLGVNGDVSTLARLHGRFETECEKLGFRRETRRFTSHLTIGRVRDPRTASALASRHIEKKFESDEFDVSGVTVYESLVDSNGSTYKIVERFGFRTA
ncbi:MAG: RNA 2',3'-cyclic phosphodiesterase [Acidobacteria bacterium]|nr:RNA 2',3'-cyclic phosphodiesterase [Acidobacteriota bacterium]